MLQQIGFQGSINEQNLGCTSTLISIFCRFFNKDQSLSTPTLDSCVAEFYFLSLQSFNIFADTTANKCWFGSPHWTGGTFVPPADPSTVYIKQGTGLD